MKRLGAMAIVALALSAVTCAFAAIPAGPRYGVYTANVGVGGGGHLEADIKVLDPVTHVALTLDCGRPTTASRSVTEVWNSPEIPLHGRSFSFHGTVSISRITTVTYTNAFVAHSSFAGTVDVEGGFTAHQRFVGTVEIAGSPCDGTPYSAQWLPGPALTGPTP